MENAKKLANYHVWFHHHEADGWITVARKEGRDWKQEHYKPEKMALKLSEWLGEDVYFSQNTFYKPFRKIENIRQIRAMYVDLDFYMLNYDENWVLGNIDLMVDDGVIPNPNMVIHSGRGVVCVWLIEPAPYKALPLWQVLQEQFLKRLQKFGADSKAIDAARVFRIAGSVNSKNGEMVTVKYRHDYRHSLRELKNEYLPELPDYEKPAKKGRPSKVVQLFTTYRLHTTRLKDLVSLCELRNYDVEGHREVILFLYRYWSCCVLNDEDQALEATLELNGQFKKPLPLKEVVSATKSAEKAWAARSNKEANELAIKKGYPGAGYNLKNTKIINWLDISIEEQKYLETVIGESEKKRRKMLANREMRRGQGVRTRKEYESERKADKEHLLNMLQRHLKRNPKAKQRELAELLGVERSYISKLKKELKM